MNARVEIGDLLPAWQVFRRSTDIGPIRNERHYGRMVKILERLLDEASGDESHPAMELVELVEVVGELVERYETERHPLPKVGGAEALRFLMIRHGLKQVDLPEIGSQGVVSEILSGRRELNIRQVRALARRFGVSPASFV